jgi:NAD-specific glutamate dehydrogenase
MINDFDPSKLGPGGYRVLVEDKDFSLPCMFLRSLLYTQLADGVMER